MQTQFKLGDLVEVQDMHNPESTVFGMYVAHDPTHSKPHIVHVIGVKYGRGRYAECKLANQRDEPKEMTREQINERLKFERDWYKAVRSSRIRYNEGHRD